MTSADGAAALPTGGCQLFDVDDEEGLFVRVVIRGDRRVEIEPLGPGARLRRE